jgi:O-methyltransferase involved in polyketide biosynthesis
VVALGDGLETQFWRVDNGQVQWLSVDLPDTLDARRRLLPSAARQQTVAASALDDTWMDEVDPGRDVLITAQGLLMYLQPGEAHDLIVRSASRFAGATMLFDTVPRWFSDRTKRGMRSRTGYEPPPMPWGVDGAETERLAKLPGISELGELHLPRGRGAFFGGLAPLLRWHLPGPLRYLASPWSIFRARFS